MHYQLIEALTRGLPADRIVVDPDVLAAMSHDDAEWAPVGQAAVGVRARSETEVGHVVRVCAQLRVPVVPRGAGTGLAGGANAVDGCVVLDLARMDQVLEVDRDNMTCVVQPGIVNNDLKALVAEQGLWYPPDPASAPWSTIGGNVSTNAGGLCCLKYGVTRDYVLGLRAVVGGVAGTGVPGAPGGTSYGDVVRLGRRTTKGVAGLDLVGLFVGGEGTLGVVTEVTLRLRPALAGTPRTIVGAFPTLVSSGEAVSLITRRSLQPSVLELLDRTCLQAVEDWKHLGLDADAFALLLARVDTPGESGDAEAAAIANAMTDAGALWAEQSSDPVEAEGLFEARRLAYPALERLGPVLTEDVCVPRSRVPQALARIEQIAARHGVTIATIAHAGDGNLHPLLVTPPADETARLAAQAAFEEIIDAAIEMGGTVSGEHGIGLLKRDGMHRELDPGAIAMQDAVRRALDPLGIFNPGKG
ncbi:MAG TPA: FAD-linked oxidase C-terminal domain-containing protein [Trebonia sp.]|jgi:glycolate oxidase|nr:FAD-linked oxidase C-terminal domain-containing protein [Trebonia sp.]